MTFLFFHSSCNFIKRAHVLFHVVLPFQLCTNRKKNGKLTTTITTKKNQPTRNIWKCCTHIHFCWIDNQAVCVRVYFSFFSKFSRCLFARSFFALISQNGIYATHPHIWWASKQTRLASRQALCMDEIENELHANSCEKCAHIGFIIVVFGVRFVLTVSVSECAMCMCVRARAHFSLTYMRFGQARTTMTKKNKAKLVHWKFQRITSTKRFLSSAPIVYVLLVSYMFSTYVRLHNIDIVLLFFCYFRWIPFMQWVCRDGFFSLFFPFCLAVDNSIWRRIIKMVNISSA